MQGRGCAASAHPRSRGEHLHLTNSNFGNDGSSPLARGTLLTVPDDNRVVRLIPARAGNTNGRLRKYLAKTAHPRSRGEHEDVKPGREDDFGSSPLARGTQICLRYLKISLRLIPARAGNTNVLLYARVCAPAHPRSRGEHLRYCARSVLRLGSSPLARGTPNRAPP